MCGRFNVLTSAQGFVDLLKIMVEIAPDVDAERRYNVAPSQGVRAVRWSTGSDRPEMVLMRWGLVPSWAKDLTIGNRMINARSESAASRPAFRASFRRRRCLVAADGWYEWRKTTAGKKPYLIRHKDRRPFFFAGLWDRWQGSDPAGQPMVIDSCAILTVDAGEEIAFIHPRMPVVLDIRAYTRWIDPQVSDPGKVQKILSEVQTHGFEAHPVSTYVNKPEHDDPRCIEPLTKSDGPAGSNTSDATIRQNKLPL